MQAVDMRCRPPLPSLWQTSMYDIEYAGKFAYKFAGSYMAESAKERSVEKLLEEMDAANITMAVYEVGQADSNQEAWEFVSKYKGKFKAMVGCDLEDIPKTIANIKRYAHLEGFCGVNMDPINPSLGDKSPYMDDEKLFRVYEFCEKENLPMTMAFGGYAYPDVTAHAVYRVENIVKNFPKLKLCFCHGCWPYFPQMCGLSMRYANIYFSPDSYLMGLPGSEDYVQAANYLLRDRIMFGTSYPFHAQKRVYEYYQNAGFREEVLPDVMANNALKFLNLL